MPEPPNFLLPTEGELAWRARLIGGMLSATGDLRHNVTVSEVDIAIDRLRAPSTTWRLDDDDAGIDEPPAQWTAPDDESLARAEGVIRQAYLNRVSPTSRPDYPDNTDTVLRQVLRRPSARPPIRAEGSR